MKRYLYSLLAALLCIATASAQSSWQGQTVNPNNYEGVGHTVYAKFDNPALKPEKYTLAAYVAGTLRGVSELKRVADASYYFIYVHGSNDDAGKPIAFHLYDSEADMEYLLPETITYSDGATLQYPSDAFAFHFIPCEQIEVPEVFYVAKGRKRQLLPTYTPEDCTHPMLTVAQTSGADFVELGRDFIVTGKEFGSAEFTIGRKHHVSVSVLNPIKEVRLDLEQTCYVGDRGNIAEAMTLVGEYKADKVYGPMLGGYEATYTNPDVLGPAAEGNADEFCAHAPGIGGINLTVTDLSTGETFGHECTITVLTKNPTNLAIDGLGNDGTLWLASGEKHVLHVSPIPANVSFDPSLLEVSGAMVGLNGSDITITATRIGESRVEISYNNGAASTSFVLHSGLPYTLGSGWNWVSAPFAETVGKLHDIFGDNLDEIRTQSTTLINDPAYGYVGDINSFANNHFKLKMKPTAPERIVVHGTTVNSTQPYTYELQPGWTWMCNLFQQEVSLDDATQLMDKPFAKGDVIKSKASGYAEYNGQKWVGTLSTLKPGEAYNLYAASVRSLTYPAATGYLPAAAPRKAAEKSSAWQYDHSLFMDNMAMTATVNELADADNFSIGAFVDEECRGEGCLTDGLWFITAHGQEGEAVTLKLLNKTSGEVLNLSGSYPLNAMIGSLAAPVQLTIATGINAVQGTATERIYNAAGVEMTHHSGALPPGIYITRSASKSTKFVVK